MLKAGASFGKHLAAQPVDNVARAMGQALRQAWKINHRNSAVYLLELVIFSQRVFLIGRPVDRVVGFNITLLFTSQFVNRCAFGPDLYITCIDQTKGL